MKKTITVLLGMSFLGLSQGANASSEDRELVSQYRQIQAESKLFDMLQHYHFKSKETAFAMQSAMNTRQLETISEQLREMNKNLKMLIALQKQQNTRVNKG